MSKYQGREVTTTIQAGNLKDLNKMISGMRLYAQSQGLGPIKILEKQEDPDGGYEAIIRAHNWNPVKWVKDKISGDSEPEEPSFAEELDEPDAAGVSDEMAMVPYQSKVPAHDYRSQGGWGTKQPLGDDEPIEGEFREADEDAEEAKKKKWWEEEEARRRQNKAKQEPSQAQGTQGASWWDKAKAHNEAKWSDMNEDIREDQEDAGSFADKTRQRVTNLREQRARDAELAREKQLRDLNVQMGIEGRKSVIRGLKQSHPGKSRAEKFEKSANKYSDSMQRINKAIIPPINKKNLQGIYVGTKSKDVYVPTGMRSLTTPGGLSGKDYFDPEGLKALSTPGGALKRASTPRLGRLTQPTSNMGASMLAQSVGPKPVQDIKLKKPNMGEMLISKIATGKAGLKKPNGNAKNSYKIGTRRIKREERL